MAIFKDLGRNQNFSAEEHSVLELWDKLDVFKESIRKRESQGKAAYVFYDGPPFATGLPHYGHIVASTLKDVVPRYWTMRGKVVNRRFGWDTHGLPIEMETEKKLGLSGPTEIRAFGVDKFNEECRSGVLRYTKEWRQVIRRLGRFVDFDNDYKTMDLNFMESVWWAFGELWKKDLIYQGFRVMPFSWRLSTPLSNFEANLDYRDVQDPAVTLSFPIKGETDSSFLVWTTTPWTLPANVAIAVGPTIDYVKVLSNGHHYYVAKARQEATFGADAQVVAEIKGTELIGKSYEPLFPYFSENPRSFVVLGSEHVTTEDGTGAVHMAPAYGVEDFDLCQKANIPAIDPVDEEGKFTSLVPDFVGLNIKVADSQIIRYLKQLGLVFKQDTIQHSYPFCWRSGTPLIYKAVPVWLVKVTEIKERMVKHNATIHWVPDSVGEKRFGNWLKDAQDWSISRNRFWGTPIPIWVCGSCDERRCISSVAELEKESGATLQDIHSHFIDDLEIKCGSCSEPMQRIKEVFDCWFDTGCMPYAQEHYPFENKDAFAKGFPAEFIAEGMDQTRGWFYTLLVLSSALFDSPPFRNVIVNGLVLAEDGSKMSKSKQNYPDPTKVLEAYGADALRAYLINSPVVRGEPLVFSEAGVKEVVRSVILPMHHAWSFFVQYANIDNIDAEVLLNKGLDSERSETDRWIISKLNSLTAQVNEHMEGYYLFKVIPLMVEFIDDLTNWYIRLSRRRFWRSADDIEGRADKNAAYTTLYEVLVTFAKILAPVLPFITENLYQSLVVQPGLNAEDEASIHLCDYPIAEQSQIDAELESSIALTRQVVSMGRALRESHSLRTRQPLASLTIVTHELDAQKAILQHEKLLCAELNVKKVIVLSDDEELCTLVFRANFKTLGRRMGTQMKAASEAIAAFERAQWKVLQDGGSIDLFGQRIVAEDVLVSRVAKGDIAVETQDSLTIAMDTKLTDDLTFEGQARDLVSHLQKLRKQFAFEVTDRISLSIRCENKSLLAAIESFRAYIIQELLATELTLGYGLVADAHEHEYILNFDDQVALIDMKKSTAIAV